ncbi:MAG TPA: undecaprenyl diphosphate synthase family protein, partial [bacterium]|nr:undecaprenyl diphosphate synthase family protein [bacterium]
LTWQGVYSELYFTKKFWPDFSERDLDEAILEFNRRTRRFGAG